jgi:hypothetical protein
MSLENILSRLDNFFLKKNQNLKLFTKEGRCGLIVKTLLLLPKNIFGVVLTWVRIERGGY